MFSEMVLTKLSENYPFERGRKNGERWIAP